MTTRIRPLVAGGVTLALLVVAPLAATALDTNGQSSPGPSVGQSAETTTDTASAEAFDARLDAQLEADRPIADGAGLRIGPLAPEGAGVGPAPAPDLVPLVGADGLIGYVWVRDLDAEMADPTIETLALPVYGPDGVTLRGHEIPERGFVPGTEPIDTVRPAPVPEGDSPFPGLERPGS